MLVNKHLVKNWIKNSELWRTFEQFDEEYLEFTYYVEDENVTNLQEFIDMLQFCTYINIDKIPFSVYIYGYYNRKEVLGWFENKLDNVHSRKFRKSGKLIKSIKQMDVTLHDLGYSKIIRDKLNIFKEYWSYYVFNDVTRNLELKYSGEFDEVIYLLQN